jgi:hypothetical protein
VVDLADGAVNEFSHETGEAIELAPSWAAWLAELAAGLEARRFKFDDGSGIVRLEDLET